MSISFSEAGTNVPTFGRFRILMRLRRPHEPSSRPPGRPSPGELETGRHGSRRRKRNGPPRVDKRASKRGESTLESQSYDETIPGILHTFISHMCCCLLPPPMIILLLHREQFVRVNTVVEENWSRLDFLFENNECVLHYLLTHGKGRSITRTRVHYYS